MFTDFREWVVLPESPQITIVVVQETTRKRFSFPPVFLLPHDC